MKDEEKLKTNEQRTPKVNKKNSITKHRQIKEEIKSTEKTLLLLNSLNNAANRGVSFNEILNLLSKETARIFSCHGATAYLVSEDGKFLLVQKQMLSPSLVNKVEKFIGKIPETKIPLKEGSLYLKMLQEGKSQIINEHKTIQDLMAEFTDSKFLKRLIPKIHRILDIKSVINIPLILDGKSIGLLDISSNKPFTESNLQEFETISEQLTLILKHKKAEELLQKSEEKLSGIIDSVTDAMIMTDEQLNIVWINDVAKELFVRNPNLIGEKCYRAFHGYENVCKPCIIRQSFKDGKVHEFETNLSGDGSNQRSFWCTSSVAAWHEDGRPKMVVEFLRDITERKRAEEEIKKSKEELERQNVELKKVDKIKDSLIHDVTHELKTPVAKHAMQLEILEEILRKHNLMDEAQNIVRVMEASIKRQEDVVCNILDLSRLEAGGRKYKKGKVCLDKILKDVFEDYHYAMDMYKIKIKMNLEEVTIRSDKEMLSHVFSNLINNAIKYRKKDIKAKIDVFCDKKGKEAIIKIIDNGIGLSKEENRKAFDRFYQASPSAEGSGVGLTISKMIIEDLDGNIWLESAGRGRGTTVIVHLPL